MTTKQHLAEQVSAAVQENNVSAVLLRNAIGRKLGLNVADTGCLCFLFIKKTSTPTELGRYTGLTTGSTTAMLDRLENAHLITRRPNPKDRRGVLIEVTQQSAKVVGPLIAGIYQAETELLASYSDQELEIIANFLTRYTASVKTHTQLLEKLTDHR